MSEVEPVMAVRLLAAIVAGGLIGLERSLHGRPAGFRTHALVCVAAAALMLVTVDQGQWIGGLAPETIRTDPTRMAQGIMTGIGFLGAGVIFREGLTVRGLTTAASIWVTSAVGILIGIGLYPPALMTTAAALGILAGFRWIERRLPRELYADHVLRFEPAAAPPEDELRRLLADSGFVIANLSYGLVEHGRFFEYRMTIRTRRGGQFPRLAATLKSLPGLVEFRIVPAGD